MPDEIIGVVLMERFKWTWEEYENTPERIIRLILAKDGIDAKLDKHRS